MPQIHSSTLFPKDKEDLRVIKNINPSESDHTKLSRLEKDDDELTPLIEPFITLAKKMHLSDNSIGILEKRYLIKNKDRQPIEQPANLFQRVAQAIAEGDRPYTDSEEEITKTAAQFFEILSQTDFLPNSPTLRGAGRKIHQLSACFVIPIPDTMEGIFDALKTTALVHKGGGGTGFSFGRLRPAGSRVGSTEGIAGGPLSFMEIFDTVGRELMQGGVRVGANMGILPVHHPDILEFIDAKLNGRFQNFNLSVAVTDEFMDKIATGEDYDLINPHSQKVVGKLNAKEVFEKMVENAWKNGDPGIIFIDEMNKFNPTPHIDTIESTNPCGEQPLLPFESCNLGSINLGNMIKDNDVNWEKLKKITHLGVHFLDNVINVNKFSHPKIEERTRGNRKIGLGVMGWADMLVQLEIPYNSEKACKLAEKVMKFINDEGHIASEKLVNQRGEFPNFKGSIFDKPGAKKIRNATVTTIAPTGTLSLIGDCAGGIEPFFALVYKKKSIWKQDGTAELEQVYVNKYFEKLAKEKGFYSRELMEEIADEGGLHNIEKVPEDVKKIFVTSHEIKPEWHIKMQAAFQKYTDNAVSKTINFPNEATIDDVRNSYLLSYQTKCKGITIYRDGSKSVQVLTTGKTEKLQKGDGSTQALTQTIKPRVRPDVVHGYTYKTKTAYGSLYVTVNEDENGAPFEVFAQMGKAGGFFAAKVEAIGRLISLALRSNVAPESIIEELKGIRGPSPIWTEEGTILSLPDAISKVLEKHLNRSQMTMGFEKDAKKAESLNGSKRDIKTTTIADMGVAPACPECGGMLEMGEGCLKCNSCGFSKCG